tara:strand:+ start:121 stop:561 length:441 start_codon:yes stop_codon:yes gene_type:complete
MALGNPFMGPGDVPSYQMSAIPYVTSSGTTEVSTSAVKVTFPNVTRFIVVQNTSNNPMKIGFTKNGVEGKGASVSGSAHEQTADHDNSFMLLGGVTTGRLELRVKEIFFVNAGGGDAGFSLLAGITPIKNTMFPTLTGSSGYIGVG